MNRKSIPTSYEAADALLGPRHTSRVIANNTALVRHFASGGLDHEGEPIGLVLHATEVATFHRDGTVTIRTGGWDTVTTLDRINRVLQGTPWHVSRKGGVARLYLHGRHFEADVQGGVRIGLDRPERPTAFVTVDA